MGDDGNKIGVIREVEILRPDGTIRPVVDFTHLTDNASLDPFADDAGALLGVSLIAHLGDDAVFAGRLGNLTSLADGPGEGFFNIDVLAQLHGPHGDGEVHVVRSGNNDGIDLVFHFIEHFPVVLIAWNIGLEVEKLLPFGISFRFVLLNVV